MPLDDATARELGNTAFAKGDYEEAVQHWERGVHSCRVCLNKGSFPPEEVKKVEDMIIPLQSNLAQGYLKLKKYFKARDAADYVLKRDPQNHKCLYRRALALQGISQPEEALKTIQSLLKIDPNNKAALSLMSSLHQERSAWKKLPKHMFAEAIAIKKEPPARSWKEQLFSWCFCCRRRIKSKHSD